MTVAATEDRLRATLGYLKRLAAAGKPAPTNTELGLKAVRMGQQRFQPWDRCTGIRTRKAEHGAVMLAALEMCGLVTVQRGSNWRRIVIVETGQVLEPLRPRFSC